MIQLQIMNSGIMKLSKRHQFISSTDEAKGTADHMGKEWTPDSCADAGAPHRPLLREGL